MERGKRRRVAYAVKEIYFTLQGEGFHTGRPAVFLRFAGCNLWTGREEDRTTAVCNFCDTDFVGVNGPGGGKFATPEDLADAGELIVTTEDGSAGRRGTTIDALRDLLAQGDWGDAIFCNVGPEQMMVAAAQIERQVVPAQRIYFSIDRHTECAIGLCGKCALDGYRLCVDGPVFSLAQLGPDSAFGKWRRGPSSRRIAV